MVKRLNRHLAKEDIQTANKQMKRCSISLTIRELQIQTLVRYYCTYSRMTKIQNNDALNTGGKVFIASGNVKWCSLAVSYKVKHILIIWSSSYTPRYLKLKIWLIWKYGFTKICTQIFVLSLLITPKFGRTKMFFNRWVNKKLCYIHTMGYYSSVGKKSKPRKHMGES